MLLRYQVSTRRTYWYHRDGNSTLVADTKNGGNISFHETSAKKREAGDFLENLPSQWSLPELPSMKQPDQRYRGTSIQRLKALGNKVKQVFPYFSSEKRQKNSESFTAKIQCSLAKLSEEKRQTDISLIFEDMELKV